MVSQAIYSEVIFSHRYLDHSDRINVKTSVFVHGCLLVSEHHQTIQTASTILNNVFNFSHSSHNVRAKQFKKGNANNAKSHQQPLMFFFSLKIYLTIRKSKQRSVTFSNHFIIFSLGELGIN